MNRERCDYITLELDVSKGLKLYFLVDSGADISLVKSYKLLGPAEFEPKDRVRVKGAEGSVIETHGGIETLIREGGIDIPFLFQLVSKQVDLKGDGILGRNFFGICSGTNLLQGAITDFLARRVCNTQEIKILTGSGKRSTSGSGGR
jgi:hypothetical protein